MAYTITEFKKDFPNNKTCLRYIYKKRFNGICPRCHERTLKHNKGRTTWRCSACRVHVSPLKGTIFEKSTTSLVLWFFAIYLISQAKNGISAKELQRHLGVTYKTAWRMHKKIRGLMSQSGDILTGIVEADETYVGGKKRNGPTGRGTGKTPVMGVVQRKGPVRAFVVPRADRKNLMRCIHESVEPCSWLMTDEWGAYRTAGYHYVHSVIKHKDRNYVEGLVHTNTIEGFWSMLKRGIKGTHGFISRKYLQSYLDYYAFHYSHRLDEVPLFYTLLGRAVDL